VARYLRSDAGQFWISVSGGEDVALSSTTRNFCRSAETSRGGQALREPFLSDGGR